MRENKNPVEFITLRSTNVKYVSERTGYAKEDLAAMLDAAKKQHRYEVKIPLGMKLFTREER